MKNDVWNTSEMLSILGGGPSFRPSLLQSLGFSQQATNAMQIDARNVQKAY